MPFSRSRSVSTFAGLLLAAPLLAQGPDFRIQPSPVVAGAEGDYTLVVQGPLNAGDVVHWRFGDAQVPSGWTAPQVDDPAGAGFIESLDGKAHVSVVTPPRGHDLEAWMTVITPVGIGAETRALFHGARAGLVAHQRSVEASLWRSGGTVQVAWVPIAAEAGPAARVHLVLPSLQAPASPATVRAAALDANDNRANTSTTDMLLEVVDMESGAVVASTGIALQGGGGTAALPPLPEGAFQVRLGSHAPLPGASNPMLVDARAATLPPILWGDTHVHGEWSLDALSLSWTEICRHARDTAFLDFLVATDHDGHMDLQTDAFDSMRADVLAEETPAFTPFPAYEWSSGGVSFTSQAAASRHSWGHRTLLFRNPDQAVLLSSRDARYRDLPGLLAGLAAAAPDGFLVIPHHLGRPALRQWWRGGPWWGPIEGVPWGLLLRHGGVAEIYSGLGPQETRASDDSWRKDPAPWEDRIVAAGQPTRRYRDACADGAAWGVVASSDGHRGYPGMGVDRITVRGLTAVFGEHGSGPVFDAIAARRSYGASARMAILAQLDGELMGGLVRPSGDRVHLRADVAGTAAIGRLVLVVDGKDAWDWSPTPEGSPVLHVDEWLPWRPGVWYLRVEQEGTAEFPDGERGWTSPWLLKS